MSTSQSLDVGELLMLIRMRSGSIAGPRIGIWQKLGNVSDDLTDPSP